jgi:fluoride exporter
MGREVLLVAFGGAGGAVSRYLLSTAVLRMSGGNFPYGTLAVNLLGAFAIGILVEAAAHVSMISPQVRLLVGVGFLGAFTTFSTLTLETVALANTHQYGYAVLNVFGSIAAGLAATVLGIVLTRLVMGGVA